MRRWHTLGVLILVPALGMLVAAPGCSKKEEPAKKTDGQAGDGGKGGKKDGGTNGGGKPGEMTELAPKEWGTLTGTVTYKGTPPEPKKIDMSSSKDKDACHTGASPRELVEQTWLVNKDNKGVSDVIIFLQPPEGKFFKIHESYLDKKNPKNQFVELRQPHCAFVPHVFPYWASYYDKETGEQKESGQRIKIINDAKFSHNTAWAGDTSVQGKGGSVTLAPEATKLLKFNADLKTPIGFNCDIHKWMNAKCLALDTPYCARTKEDGTFKIENVPVGVELYVVGWHQDVGYFYGGKTGTKMTLEKTTDLKIPISK
jgi:hypothetical protein